MSELRCDSVSGNEILTLCIGQSGVFIGNQYYKTIMNQHKIDKNGKFIGNMNKNSDHLLLSKINTYFKNDSKTNQYIPRSMFIDIDKTCIDKIRSSNLGSLIDDDNMINGMFSGPTVLWPKAHYFDGQEMIDDIMNKIRREIEICDYYQGSNIIHSISGGTGSGLTTLILDKLYDNYPDRNKFVYTLYPSQMHYTAHNETFEIYNSLLAIFQLLFNSSLNFPIHNAMLLNICKNQCKLNNPKYDDLNWMISLLLNGITSPIRLHSEPSFCNNLQSMHSYFVPFPRLHFVATCHSPFWYQYNNNYNVINITKQALSFKQMININDDGRYLNAALIYRSNNEMYTDKINLFLRKWYYKNKTDFITWIVPDSFTSSKICDGNNNLYDKYSPMMATSIANTTGIKAIYQRISNRFSKLFKTLHLVHYYKSYGMDNMEFSEADKNIRDLITEYQDKEQYDDDDDNEEYEDDDDEEEQQIIT